MGTNFYILTADKDVRDKYFGTNYDLTDCPVWGYQQHIAKTSSGWLPLFDGTSCFKSIKELKAIYDTGLFVLCDEYGNTYNWDEFDKRVLKFNGGVVGGVKKMKYDIDKTSPYHDPDMPEYLPVSHFEYGNGRYAYDYFKDEEGYEFNHRTFF